MSDVIQHDIIVVGGGGAGLRAAIEIGELNPNLSVAMVSKVYPMRSHTVAAEGGAAGVIKDNDSLDHHFYDTVSGADWLADQDAVEYFVNDAPKQLTKLEHWGCPWSREPDGRVAVRPFGGMKIERTWFAADKTGFHMLHALFQTSLKYNNVVRYDEYFATKLLVSDNGQCQGVAALEMRTGSIRTFVGKAVIICSGGGGRMFPFTTNGAIKTGDGLSMCYRAGVGLKDMEFVQYHPTGLPGNGILITEAARGEGGILLNRDGRRFLQDHDLGTPIPVDDPRHPQKRMMELGPRDRLSQAFQRELEKGKVLQTDDGVDVMNLDIRHLGEKKINKKLPFVRELAKNYAGVDPVYEPIPVRPVIHYCMGGIDTDSNAATDMPGLYAAGECACVSINGANRLGSNSLTELLVFGALAGRKAADYLQGVGDIDVESLKAQAVDEQERISKKFLTKTDGTERVNTIRTEMQTAMEAGAGIFRTESKLQTAIDKLAELRERFDKNVYIDDRNNCFNTDLTAALELDHMLDCAQALTHSAIARTESRGSHQREDYTERNDEKFLKHSVAFRNEDGTPRIEYKDVTITSLPPAERKYGR